MSLTPVSERNPADPGDDTSRRFRYQHAYGVILWVAAYRRELEYIAIWCEQHEDFLGQIGEKQFDAFQIKTREAEIGFWEFGDEPLFKSIARFVKLDELFPGQIREFYFVSNARCSESDKPERHHLCPGLVLKACMGQAPLPDFCEKSLKFLAEKTGCTREAVLAVLKRTKVQAAPSLTDIDDVVRQTHLPAIDGLTDCSATELATLFDRLLGRIRDASSLASRDPARHYPLLNGGFALEPQLGNKRVVASDLRSQLDYLKLLSGRAATRTSANLAGFVNPDTSGTSPMARLIARYNAETDQEVKQMVQRLKQWHDRPAGDVIGLEEKLQRGKRPDMLDFAVLAKERFARALARHEYSPAAQEIYAYLLAQVWTIFSQLVFTQIARGAAPETVNLILINDVYPRIEKLLEDNPLGIDAAEIQGMLFWLTGNCHIKWTQDADLQPSV